MADPLAGYSLRPVQSPQQWSAYHAIRRDAIFATLLPGQVYDEHDPDEFEHRHRPHVLVRDGEVIGTVRIDLIGDIQAGLRLIAIRRDLQRQGHGSVLLRLAEQAARAFGKTEIVINAHPTSLTFYLANGYRDGEWRDAHRCRQPSFGSASGCRSKLRVSRARRGIVQRGAGGGFESDMG